MIYQIKNRYNDSVIYESEAESLSALVRAAIESGASLSQAVLVNADLSFANLSGANLTGADLYHTYLPRANLTNANLFCADLSGANLYGADLSGADLSDADLSDANLQDATGLHQIVPAEGSFIAFKKLSNGVIAKLQIPEDAGRVGGWLGRKCRAEKAIILEGEGVSRYDLKFEYKPGVTVIPDKWNADPRLECSNGIHFFLTREEAEQY